MSKHNNDDKISPFWIILAATAVSIVGIITYLLEPALIDNFLSKNIKGISLLGSILFFLLAFLCIKFGKFPSNTGQLMFSRDDNFLPWMIYVLICVMTGALLLWKAIS